MNRCIILAFVFFTTVIPSVSQEIKIDTIYSKDTSVLKKTFIDGEVILMEEYTLTNILVYRANYKNGKKNGFTEAWDNERRKILKLNYKNDFFDGYYRSWYPTGEIEADGEFINRKGTIKYYSKDGNLTQKESAIDNGVLTKTERYCDNGKIKALIIYEGEYCMYQYFYCNGNPKSQGKKFRQYYKEGEWEYWDENGNLLKVETYDEDFNLIKTDSTAAGARMTN